MRPQEDPGALECGLCCHRCRIPEGKSGFCGVRYNRNGQFHLPYYGYITAVNIDPMEKKPLYHFYPGSRVFSLGFAGCSFRCPFCQNWQISQISSDPPGGYRTPGEAVQQAVESGCGSLAFTYSEPTIHFEYCLETSRLARQQGLKTVLVTNGNLLEAPARELLGEIDGVNADLKSFSADYYRRVLKGDLDTVKRFLELAAELSHLEATTLIVPGDNDSPEELTELFDFLAGISPLIPLHLSAYRPSWQYSRAGTPESILEDAVHSAEERLSYVYPGNSRLLRNTHCPDCGELLIRREAMGVQSIQLRGGKCPRCGRPFDGVVSS